MKAETHQDFPEVKGKIIDTVELSVENDYYGISIRFQDKTALTFTIESGLVTFPEYADWTDGEEKTLKRYEPVRSKVSLETEARLKS
jgi:hypothetical protein